MPPAVSKRIVLDDVFDDDFLVIILFVVVDIVNDEDGVDDAIVIVIVNHAGDDFENKLRWKIAGASSSEQEDCALRQL